MKKILVLVLGVVSLTLSSKSTITYAGQLQMGAAVPGQFIVRFKKGVVNSQQFTSLSSAGIATPKAILKNRDIYVVKTDPAKGISPASALQLLQNSPFVKYVQKDHYVYEREAVIPNDAQFSEMWDMLSPENKSDIRATEAWEFGTGGTDAAGNRIAVAVVDGGFEIEHKDLEDNIWTNELEIPGNDIDDDGNGYVDDVHGWNAYSNSGHIESGYHGTHVAGTVGAVGNNELQVTGVNWDVDIVPILGSSGSTSTVARAYGYAIELKKRWLETGGKEGANIVSTNSSFGIDFADCNSSDYPIWNDLYDELGSYGILSAAATINDDTNVDEFGDVPTGCSSDHLITVTNTTKENVKYQFAGYGGVAIDLGAPGTDILSTVPGNNVDTATGTSMATPHVAGAIAFLHSVANEDFNQFYLQNPSDGALELKRIILKSTQPLESLKEVTVSGGRLDLRRAAEYLQSWPLEPSDDVGDDEGEGDDEGDAEEEEGVQPAEPGTDPPSKA